MAKKTKVPATVRVLAQSEYPQGTRNATVVFAAQHPLGLYHVEDHGIESNPSYFAFFTAARKGSRPKAIGFGGGQIAGALRRISNHEDELVNKDAPRERGEHGPVSIYALGKRTGGPKPPSQLDREIEAFLARSDEGIQ